MSSYLQISHPSKKITADCILPGSKSESNRLLIINELSGKKIQVENLSSADDTQELKRLLASPFKTLDVKDAGTSMRFLIAYFCVINRNKVISGSQRMQERPIGKLVDALRYIGFKIHYLQREGFPPVEVIPTERTHLKYELNVEADESSQFISALLMIAPVFPDGLTIRLQKRIVSKSYIKMTLGILKKCGINSTWKKNEIRIDHQKYRQVTYKAEPDWSAASYWYSIAALSTEAHIELKGFRKNSFQGDQVISEWMKNFGVSTQFTDDGILIRKESEPVLNEMTFDFNNSPDLAQTIIVLAAAKNINLKMKGLKTLRIKETDRIAALQKELRKIGAHLVQHKADFYEVKPNYKNTSERIETYNDHRMAMAFAPLALNSEISIIQPSVVTKSYPDFWKHLKNAGFEIK
ncbi:MAG TPA: 3-phosphoshikimate 1-carboxyvinyltransferase [Bacteroidia bacterium]|nr:3-phosphoshikimate 1-carboxyvinyltransferase [Bacteroidia bacterium]